VGDKCTGCDCTVLFWVCIWHKPLQCHFSATW
jgi:hypothetical protein